MSEYTKYVGSTYVMAVAGKRSREFLRRFCPRIRDTIKHDGRTVGYRAYGSSPCGIEKFPRCVQDGGGGSDGGGDVTAAATTATAPATRDCLTTDPRGECWWRRRWRRRWKVCVCVKSAFSGRSGVRFATRMLSCDLDANGERFRAKACRILKKNYGKIRWRKCDFSGLLYILYSKWSKTNF